MNSGYSSLKDLFFQIYTTNEYHEEVYVSVSWGFRAFRWHPKKKRQVAPKAARKARENPPKGPRSHKTISKSESKRIYEATKKREA